MPHQPVLIVELIIKVYFTILRSTTPAAQNHLRPLLVGSSRGLEHGRILVEVLPHALEMSTSQLSSHQVSCRRDSVHVPYMV